MPLRSFLLWNHANRVRHERHCSGKRFLQVNIAKLFISVTAAAEVEKVQNPASVALNTVVDLSFISCAGVSLIAYGRTYQD